MTVPNLKWGSVELEWENRPNPCAAFGYCNEKKSLKYFTANIHAKCDAWGDERMLSTFTFIKR